MITEIDAKLLEKIADLTGQPVGGVLTSLFAHEGVTTTVEFGVAFPQIRTLLFCCKTILSLSSGGNLTFASILMLHSTIIKK